MLSSAIPAKFTIPWGNSAAGPYIRTIPTASQIGIQNGAASLTDGFPPLNFSPVGAGGIPPFGQDFNGILNQLTAWSRWQGAGGTVKYDATFQTAIGGYPQGALVQSAVTVGLFWFSLVDNNVTNPDAGGAGWTSPFPNTGDTKWRPTAEVLPGWTRMNSLTIGNASSSATERANADTLAQFTWVYNNFSNAQCPVSGGRGASAAADFAANKNIQLPDMRFRAPVGLAGMGAGAVSTTGALFTSGSSNVSGSFGGEVAHTLVVGEIPGHTHGVNGNTGGGTTGTGTTGNDSPDHTHSIGNAVSSTNVTSVVPSGTFGSIITATGGASTRHTHTIPGLSIPALSVSITTDTGTGGGGTHNTMPPFMLGTWYLKL